MNPEKRKKNTNRKANANKERDKKTHNKNVEEET